MNKFIISIALVLSVIPATTVFAYRNQVTSPITHDRIQVIVNQEFPIDMYLAAFDFGRWNLQDCYGLELLNYELKFDAPAMMGSTRYQSWKFRANHPGIYTLKFERDGVIKTILVEVDYE